MVKFIEGPENSTSGTKLTKGTAREMNKNTSLNYNSSKMGD